MSQELTEIVIDILNQCKRFRTDALMKYAHKVGIFQTDLNVDQVNQLHQKIDIVLERLKP